MAEVEIGRPGARLRRWRGQCGGHPQ